MDARREGCGSRANTPPRLMNSEQQPGHTYLAKEWPRPSYKLSEEWTVLETWTALPHLRARFNLCHLVLSATQGHARLAGSCDRFAQAMPLRPEPSRWAEVVRKSRNLLL